MLIHKQYEGSERERGEGGEIMRIIIIVVIVIIIVIIIIYLFVNYYLVGGLSRTVLSSFTHNQNVCSAVVGTSSRSPVVLPVPTLFLRTKNAAIIYGLLVATKISDRGTLTLGTR